MTDRSIFVRLGAIATGLRQELRGAAADARKTAAEVEAAGKRADAALIGTAKKVPLVQRALAGVRAASTAVAAGVKVSRAEIDQLANSGMLVGTLMTAGFLIAQKRVSDFDQAMSHVAATGDDARANLGALREAAVQAGADTAFSAREAAEGVEALAKAGVSAQDSLSGGLTGSLSLAAASNLTVAESAEVAATALIQFGLAGSQMSHVADLLAAGAGKAQGEVSDLALALKYVGPVASGMNVSIEETVGALAAFASQGILADQAGTSLRGVLAALTSPSKAAQDEIKRLGITLYDGEGRFLGLANMAGQLQKAYSGVSDQAKDASLGILFGNQQVTAARVLFDQGAAGIQGWTEKVNDAGYAAEAARVRMDNLAGDIERLGGSIDSVLIQSGSGANQTLRDLVQGAESAVDAIGQLPPGVMSVVTSLAGAGGLGILGVSALGKLVVGINDARIAMAGLNIATKTAGITAGVLGAVITVGVLAFGNWAAEAARARDMADEFLNTLEKGGNTTAATLDTINTKLTENTAWWDGEARTLAEIGTALGLSTRDMVQYIAGAPEAIAKTNAALDAYVEAQIAAGESGFAAADGADLFRTGLNGVAGPLRDATKKAIDKAKADREAGAAANSNASAQKTINSYLTGQTDALGNATVSLDEYTASLWNAADAALKLSGSDIGFWQAVHDANKGIRDERHKGKGVDTKTQAGRDNQRDLDQIVASGKARVDNLVAEKGAGKEAAAAMQELRDAYIKARAAATGSREEAEAFADELKLLPDNVVPKIEPTLDETAQRKWDKWNPPEKNPKITPELTTSTLYVRVVRGKSGQGGGGRSDLDKDNADGNLFVRSALGMFAVQRFADGGFASIGAQQPQIRPYAGPRGLTWGEEGSGPWEAFVSGHPAKITRSRQITSEVASRLGGVASFADGGIRTYRDAVAAAPFSGPSAGAIAGALADVLQARGISMLTIAEGVTGIQNRAYERSR